MDNNLDLLTVFQIGDVVLPLANEDWHGYGQSLDVKEIGYLFSDKLAFPEVRGSGNDLKISGYILPTHIYMQDQLITKLMSLQRKVVEVIAFVDLDNMPDLMGEGEEHAYETGPLWFENTCLVKSVEATNDGSKTTITINIKTDSYWTPLDRVKWQYRANKLSAGATYDIVPNLIPFNTAFQFTAPLPFRGDIQNYISHGRLFAKRKIVDSGNLYFGNYEYIFDNWDTYWTENFRMGYPQVARQFTSLNTFGNEHFVSSDPTLFNAPLRSWYALSLFSASSLAGVATGNFTLTVQTQKDGWHYETNVTEMNFADLLESYTARGYGSSFISTDWLFFGDTFMKPGFIARVNIANSQILSDVSPLMNYDGDWPGFCETGHSKVTLGFSGLDVTDLSFYALHLFRRY